MTERESRRKAFEKLGPEQLRLRLEYRRDEYAGDYGREAETWLFEKAAEAAALERIRFETIRRWAIIGSVVAVVAAIAGLIAAWPVIASWIRQVRKERCVVSSELVPSPAPAAEDPNCHDAQDACRRADAYEASAGRAPRV